MVYVDMAAMLRTAAWNAVAYGGRRREATGKRGATVIPVRTLDGKLGVSCSTGTASSGWPIRFLGASASGERDSTRGRISS